MKVTYTPETELEQSQFSEQVYTGVQEIFMFGSMKNEEGTLDDFHYWKGNPRYLLGSLNYFYNEINDERRAKKFATQDDGITRQFKMRKDATIDNPGIQVVELPEDQDQVEQVEDDIKDFPPIGFDLNKNE